MINKKLSKKDIPRVIISLFVISLGLSIGCMFYNKFVLRRKKVVEGLTAAGSIVEDAKQQELEDLELYPKRVTYVDDIPIKEIPPQPTNVDVPTGDDSTNSKIYYNASIACGKNVASVPGITSDMSDDKKIKLCDDACKNNPECNSWYVSSDNQCWLKPCREEKDIKKMITLTKCKGQTCTKEQEGYSCMQTKGSEGWCCKSGVWNKGLCKKPIVGMLQDMGSYTAAIPSEGGTKELCNGIVGGKFFGPGGADMSDKQTIAPGCSETAWCCRPIGPILRYQSDSPGWQNAWGTTCKQYAEKFCKDGSFRPGMEWTGGEKHSYPDKNCVACGKGRS